MASDDKPLNEHAKEKASEGSSENAAPNFSEPKESGKVVDMTNQPNFPEGSAEAGMLYARYWLDKLIEGKIDDKNLEWLEAYAADHPDVQDEIDRLSDPEQLQAVIDRLEALKAERPVAYQELLDRLSNNKKRRIIRKVVYLSAAAAVVVITFLGIREWASSKTTSKLPAIAMVKDLAPGSNKAILTLSNGTSIVLDSAHTGIIAQYGKTNITNNPGGELSYTGKGEASAEVFTNTITTPKGGQYQIVLADGTRVWLNAGSSLQYPTAFTGHQRRVKVTGEAYFAVARDPHSPFVVETPTQQVTVLGTEFDVLAYPDEPRQPTTLLSGRVKISGNKGKDKELSPGEQAQLDPSGNLQVVRDVDIDAVVGWKNETFAFDNADLPTIMRQISRWYDVEIIWEGGLVPPYHYTASMSRKLPVSQLLIFLSETRKVTFTIVGNAIHVKKIQ